MPTATILSPRTGDTVNKDNVNIAVAYANFANATDLKCQIGTHYDAPENVNGDGLHGGTATTTYPPAQQTVVTFTDGDGELARQEMVNVTAGDTPNPIDEPILEMHAETNKKKLKKVKGKVPNTSTATKVVCKVNRIDARNGTITEVGSKEGPVDQQNHKWEVDFNIELDTEKYIQYFVRVCAYKNNTLLGCESRPVKK
jgi:hypothetical protein